MKLKIALIACVGFTSTLTAMPIVTAQAGIRAARIAMGLEEVRMESSGGGQPAPVDFTLPDGWHYEYDMDTDRTLRVANHSQETSSTTERDLPITVVEVLLTDVDRLEASGYFLIGWPSLKDVNIEEAKDIFPINKLITVLCIRSTLKSDPKRPGADFNDFEREAGVALTQIAPNGLEGARVALNLVFSPERAQAILNAIVEDTD